MDGNRVAGVRDFKARPPSRATFDNRIRIGVIIGVCIMAPALVVWAVGRWLPSFVPWLVFGILLLVTIVLLGTLLIVSLIGDRVAAGVHYEVSDTELRLFGGPVQYTIPLNTITRVYTRDMDLRLRNQPMRRATGVRMPNLSLADVNYKDTGPLKMCATSIWEDITIIETTGLKYGVTPEDKEGFKAALGVKG